MGRIEKGRYRWRRSTFAPTAIPWLKAQPLELDGFDLGLVLDGFDLAEALGRLCAVLEPQAVVALGSRGCGDAAADSDLDLAVIAKEPQLAPEAKLHPGPAAMRRREWCRWAGILWSKAVSVQRGSVNPAGM